MDQLPKLLESLAEKVGVRILVSSQDLDSGFEGIHCRMSDHFYGIKPSLDHIIIGQTSFEDAYSKGHFSADMEMSLAKRCFRIAQDTVSRSERNGIRCYNGTLAKLVGARKIRGSTTVSDFLELDFCRTSYFTALGTNIWFRGYKYVDVSYPDEPKLPSSLDWVENQTISLRDSRLANQLAVHLIIYNGEEILYVRRGMGVGESTGFFNSPVNGVVEFAERESDVDQDGNPDVYRTAIREANYELSLSLARDRIKWLALAVTKDKLEPFLIGKCKIEESGREIQREMLEAQEAFEVANMHRKAIREKEVCCIPKRCIIDKVDISVPIIGTATIPTRLVLPPSVEEIIHEKIVNQRELTRSLRSFGRKQVKGQWHHSAAVALLYALPTFYNKERITSAVEHELGCIKGSDKIPR